MLDFKRRRFDSDIILLCVRWYLAYPLSYRNIEEMMLERGIAVDKNGETVDFLLTANRDRKAAHRFFRKAIASNGTPLKINIDKSGANTAGIEDYNEKKKTKIEIR